jgi:pimeloyl-ACP methyl ester carboxylesterase
MRGEFVDLAGARIYYYAAGTRGAGNPVVLIHGFPTSSHLWNDVVPLMPAGHRIVVLDLLGYGRSDRPLGRPVDIPAHAARTIALMDELRIDRACVVGHGMGGGIAQWIALKNPERISHLALIDSVSLAQGNSVHEGVTRAAMPLMRPLPHSTLLSLVKRDLLHGYQDPIRALRSIELYLRPFIGGEGRDALLAHFRGGRTPSGEVQLRDIRAPTAIVWGENDRAVSLAVGSRLRDTIPGSQLDVLGSARHFTPEESPRDIADAIQRLLACATPD